jgi:hypothetical protein
MTKLKLVRPADPSGPPRPLGRAGMALWERILAEYVIEDIAGLEMLCHICQEQDTVQNCMDQVAQDGPILRTKNGGIREHPCLRPALASRSFIVRTLRSLGLDSEPIKPIGRPPMKGYQG